MNCEEKNKISEVIAEHNKTVTNRNICMLSGVVTDYSRRKDTCEVSFQAIDIDLFNKVMAAMDESEDPFPEDIAEEAAGLTVTFSLPRAEFDKKEWGDKNGNLNPKWFAERFEYTVTRLPLGLPNCVTIADYPLPDKETLAKMTPNGLIAVGDASNCRFVFESNDD